MHVRQGSPWLAALAAATLACHYAYDNPAEQLSAGQVSGRTVHAEPAVAPAPGISVSLKGSTFDQLSKDTGRFTVLPLPVGRHTLLFRQGLGWSTLRVVDVALGRDGQPEGVHLGDVDVPLAASLEGAAASAVALPPGTALDEVTGLTAMVLGGRFQLDGMALGDHLLKLALVDTTTPAEWVGGPLPVAVEPADQGFVKGLSAVQVRLATAAEGLLRFRVVSLDPDIAPGAVDLRLEEALRGLFTAPIVPDGDGYVELSLPEGLYLLRAAPPAAFAGAVPSPEPATAVILAGETADLGSLYLVPDATVSAAEARCLESADCGANGGPCTAGTCTRYAPPPAPPASLPQCPLIGDSCSPGSSCTSTTGFLGMCVGVAGAPAAACIPCGTSCTVDGAVVLTAPAVDPKTGTCHP